MDNQLNHKFKLPKLFWIFTVLILLAVTAFLIVKYKALQEELREINLILETRQINEETLNFTKLFIVEVLKAETEVDFETRLLLENAVRSLGDAEILTGWQKFTESKTETEAQKEVKNLLELLMNKIKVDVKDVKMETLKPQSLFEKLSEKFVEKQNELYNLFGEVFNSAKNLFYASFKYLSRYF